MEAERAGDDEGWNGVRRDTGVDVVDGVTGGLKDEDTRQDVSDGLVSGGTSKGAVGSGSGDSEKR